MKSVFALPRCIAALTIAALTFTANVSAQELPEVVKAEVVKAKPVDRPASAAPSVRPLSVSIDLLSNTNLSGTLTDTTTLEMRTSFGIANIPLSEVAGIRFASADDATTTVVMLNGDSITGATDVKLVTVETEWGMATINGPNIASIMFVPGLSWNPSAGLNGKRWNLANNKGVPAGKPGESENAGAPVDASSAAAARSRSSSSGFPAPAPQPTSSTFRGR
jgi:hypothetical protein